MGLLSGKTALITGATRGIGRAIALKFAAEGADVVFTYRQQHQAADDLVKEIEAMGMRAKAISADASSFENAESIAATVKEEFGQIDILVNNAGITKDGLVMRMTEEQWDSVIENNLKSAFNYIRACVPVMARQRSGSIISISSVVGVAGNAGQCNYAASKAGIIGLTKSIAKEMGPRGIRANCIAPGFIKTDMTDSLPEKVREEIAATIPMKRQGMPEDVANVALFLASGLSAYVSGQVINCCGAMNC